MSAEITNTAKTGTVKVDTGSEVLHFNESTGRIIRVVRIVEIRGEAAIVEGVNGKTRGRVYPVSLSALATD